MVEGAPDMVEEALDMVGEVVILQVEEQDHMTTVGEQEKIFSNSKIPMNLRIVVENILN